MCYMEVNKGEEEIKLGPALITVRLLFNVRAWVHSVIPVLVEKRKKFTNIPSISFSATCLSLSFYQGENCLPHPMEIYSGSNEPTVRYYILWCTLWVLLTSLPSRCQDSLTILPKTVALFNKATLSPQKTRSLNGKYLPDHMKTKNCINLAVTFALRVTAIRMYSLFQSVLLQLVLSCLIKCSLMWSTLLLSLTLLYYFLLYLFLFFTQLYFTPLSYVFLPASTFLYSLLWGFILQCTLVYSVLLYSVR
jgi:hypothetical protein